MNILIAINFKHKQPGPFLALPTLTLTYCNTANSQQSTLSVCVFLFLFVLIQVSIVLVRSYYQLLPVTLSIMLQVTHCIVCVFTITKQEKDKR